MPISTPLMIGAACLFLVIIVVIIAVTSGGDDVSDEVVDIGTFEPTSDVLCSAFDGCPDDMEIIPGANGESESECCQKKTCQINGFQCKTTPCSSSEGCWDPIPDARGDSEEECCGKALCSENICDNGYKLRERISSNEPNSGRTNSECCEEKPLCTESICAVSGYESKSTTAPPKGDTLEECCNPKSCWLESDDDLSDGDTEANGWNDAKCGDSSLGGGDGWQQFKNDTGVKMGHTIKGNTKEVCCQEKTCISNGWTEAGIKSCDEGYKPTKDDNVRGNDKDSCCVPKTCSENDWTDDLCRINDPENPTVKMGDPVGNNASKCCGSRICSDYYFDGDDCSDKKGGDLSPDTSSKCFTASNQYPGQETDSSGNPVSITDRKLKENCSFYNRRLVSGDIKIPGVIDEEEKKNTCCIPKTCGDFENLPLPGDSGTLLKDICDVGQEFSEKSSIPLLVNTDVAGSPEEIDTNMLKDTCCSTLKCSEDFALPSDCKTHYDDNPDTTINLFGSDFDSDNLTPDLTKRDSESVFGECCKAKTCGVAFPGDTDCVAIQSEADINIGGLKRKLSAVDEAVFGNGRNCCETKKCSEVDYPCPDWTDKKNPAPDLDGSLTNCCTPKLCTELPDPWTNAKCKDKAYTRASVRGKLKPGARVNAADQGPTDTEIDNGGDLACCEQDNTNNFSRMCVGEEYRNNIRTNYSVGALIPSTIIDSGSRTVQTPENCRQKCISDSECGSFGVYGNHPPHASENKPTCYKYRKFPEGTDIPKMVGAEFGVKPTLLAYVSGGHFPEEHRYSGAKRKSSKPRLTGTGDALTRLDDGGSQLEKSYQWDANGSGLNQRNNATSLSLKYKADWSKRKDILLAGVDKEFCPIDHVRSYGTRKWNSTILPEMLDAGTYHPHASANAGLLQASETGLFNETTTMTDGQQRNKEGCTSLNVNNSLEDCYRNLRCGSNWVASNSPANFNDTAAAKINGQSLMNLSHKRRVCPKKTLIKSSNNGPYSISAGAVVQPTRIYESTCSNSGSRECSDPAGRVRYGVMQPKSKLTGETHWDGGLLPGDHWNDLKVNTTH